MSAFELKTLQPPPSRISGVSFHPNTVFHSGSQAFAKRDSRSPEVLHDETTTKDFSDQTRLSWTSSASSGRRTLRSRDVSRYIETAATGKIGRNSGFYGLTVKEREELGGHEYRALKYLCWLVPLYFVLMQLFGCLGCGAWMARYGADASAANGLNAWWVGAFNAVSAFNNSGMSLLDANMTPFSNGYYLLITMGFLILAGNTCYPIFLRCIIWVMSKFVHFRAGTSTEWVKSARTLDFLLDHPRRCYTHLFPSQHTYYLTGAVIALNTFDWAAYEFLNIGNGYIEAFPAGDRVVDGLFQALAVRSGGFYVVALAKVRLSLQVLYVGMMYIGVFPVTVTIRNSNVYEERSLGIYADEIDAYNAAARHEHNVKRASLLSGVMSLGESAQQSNRKFVLQQMRTQHFDDIAILFVALLLIAIIEGSQVNSDPAGFSIFNILFELVSGYGCVGLTIGAANGEAYSFCGTWHTLSKFILCLVMLKGRHRGLPVAMDRAVLLPSQKNGQMEEEDGRRRRSRTLSQSRDAEVV